VAQDENVAGVEAAKEFVQISEGEIVDPLFINHENKGNTGIEDRYRGFHDTILNATGIETKELVIDGFSDDEVLVESIRPAFTDCPYDIVQMPNARTIDLAISLPIARTFLCLISIKLSIRVLYSAKSPLESPSSSTYRVPSQLS
jgi:hypothetical protein